MFYEKIMWLNSKYKDKPRFKEFEFGQHEECTKFINDFHVDTVKYNMNDPKIVGICLSIGKIEEVDTNKQTIKAGLELKLRIKNSEILEIDKKKVNYDFIINKIKKEAEPEFTIINAIEENLKYKYIQIVDYENGIIDYNYHYICTLFDEVNVHNFPFDWQSFRVNILLSDSREIYDTLGYLDDNDFLNDNSKIGNRIFNNNTFIPDWNIFGLNGGTETLDLERSAMGVEILGEEDNPRLSMIINDFEDNISNNSYFNKKLFSCTFWLQRKPFYVLSTIWLINFIIMLIGVLSFKIPEDDLNDRLGFDATLLLTLVAQKFSFQDSVPKVSYLTLYDKKLLYNFLNLLFLMVIHGYSILSYSVVLQQSLYISTVIIGEIVFFSYGFFSNKIIYYK
jgi:hypothetical protein